MKSTKIIVRTRNKSYPIYFGDGILNSIETLIKKNVPNANNFIYFFSFKKFF